MEQRKGGGGQGEVEDGLVRRVHLLVGRRCRHVLRQQGRRLGDGRLDVLGGRVDVPVQGERERDLRQPEAAAGHHGVQPGDRGELALEGGGHGGGHRLGAGAGKVRRDQDRRKIDVGEIAHRQALVRQGAEQQQGAHHEGRHDGTANEEIRNIHRRSRYPPVPFVASTLAPGTSRSCPSVTTFSPASDSFPDDRLALEDLSGGDGARFHGEVGPDDEHVLSLLPGLDRLGGDDDGAGPHGQRQDHVGELARPQAPVGVREGSFQLDRPRRRVDRVSDEGEGARHRVRLPVLRRRLDLQRAGRLVFPDVRQVLLRDGEGNADGDDLVDGHERRVVRLDDVPPLDEEAPGPAVDRGPDEAIGELHACVLDGGGIGLDGGLEGRGGGGELVVLLPGDEVLLDQGSVAANLLFRVVLQGDVPRAGRFGHLEGRLVRRGVDLEQEVPLAHVLPFRKTDLHDLAADHGLDGNGGIRLHRPDRADLDGDVFLNRGTDRHRDALRRLRGGGSAAGRTAAEKGRDDQGRKHPPEAGHGLFPGRGMFPRADGFHRVSAPQEGSPGGCTRVVARPGILDTISGGYGSGEGWGTIKKMQINPNRPFCPIDRRRRMT